LLIQSILFIAGITGVYFGAEWLVKGSSKLSRDLGIKPIVVGLTVVAFGTSSPELAVSLTASINGSNDIAIGNIIGSNIANIGLVFGIAAIVLPLHVEKIIMKREFPLMIAISAGLYFMAIDKKIGFVDGLVLFTGIIFFISYQIYNTLNSKGKSGNSTGNVDETPSPSSSEYSSLQHSDSGIPDDNASTTERADKQSQTRRNLLFNIVYIIIGLACLLIGAHILVKSAIFIAGRLGVSEMVIGLTVVAIGTSVPEMATSVVSVLRKEVDICVGNVIGSNIFNILMVIGSVALVKPLDVARDTLFFEFPVMLFFSLALIPLMFRANRRVNRRDGFLLVVGYFAFIFLLYSYR
jgi:cation:H+ antiporter